MGPEETTAFVNGYTRILTGAWSSEEFSRRLDAEPAAVLAECGLDIGPDARVNVVRTRDADADLPTQIRLWEIARHSGRYILYVPAVPQVDVRDLVEEELGRLAGGAGGGYCCNPCCCQS